MCKLNKFHGKVNINSPSIETGLNFDDLIQVLIAINSFFKDKSLN